jgi:hypothetical protein
VELQEQIRRGFRIRGFVSRGELPRERDQARIPALDRQKPARRLASNARRQGGEDLLPEGIMETCSALSRFIKQRRKWVTVD